MPIIQSAIKDARKNLVRRARRQPFKTQLKTQIRKYTDLVKAGKADEAAKTLPQVFKAIDTATKKHLLHPNNASRKKSSLSRMINTKKK